MGNSSGYRYEWLKAVNRSKLLPRAKVVATALALEFFNEETGQLNPGIEKIAAASGSAIDTVKRGIRDLIDGGWLGRTEGRGRGNKTTYQLCSPGKVVALPTRKKGAQMHHEKGGTGAPLNKEKGARVRGKGGTGALSYIEQSSEQKGRAWDAFAKHRFPGNFSDGAMYLDKSRQYHDLTAWSEWLRKHGFPKLCELPISADSGKSTIFALPYRTPPTREDQVKEAMAYFTAMADHREVHHAAQ